MLFPKCTVVCRHSARVVPCARLRAHWRGTGNPGRIERDNRATGNPQASITAMRPGRAL